MIDHGEFIQPVQVAGQLMFDEAEVKAWIERQPRGLYPQKPALRRQVVFSKEAGVCQTLEGQVAYQAGDAILPGVVGESWPVEREKLDMRYSPTGTTRPGDGQCVKKPLTVYAVQLDEYMELTMPEGGMLQGTSGDWLLQYGTSDGHVAVLRPCRG